MNKVTKYFTGAAALLMLMSVGAVQNNVNASRKNYRAQVTRNVNHKWMNKRALKNNKVRRNKKRLLDQKVDQKKINKRNKRSANNKKQRRIHKALRRGMKRNHRNVRKHVRQLKRRRYHSNKVLKPRYKLTNDNRRGNRELRKSGFVDGRILTKMGYSQGFNDLIFNKYAPNDKRARIPEYMNPKTEKIAKKVHVPSYNDVNKDFWVQGRFDLSHPQKNTKDPQVYKYYPKLHGWKLAPRR